MKIELKKLTLENFKGIKNLTVAFPNAITSIYGDNGTGKTSIVDAFSWLLSGKDSTGKTDFQLKTLEAGKEIHKLKHSVEAVLSVDETEVTLKRTFSEKWTTQRGAAVADFSGHTTDYEIDGVPHKQKDWETKLSEIFGDMSIFGLVTSVSAFNMLDWKQRRAILLDVCGDVTDADVINSNPELAPLAEVKRSLEDEKKVISSTRKEILEKLKEIPARIDELNRQLETYAPLNINALEAKAESLEKRIDEAKASGGVTEFISKKTEFRKELADLEHEHDKACKAAKSEAENRLDEAKSEHKKATGIKLEIQDKIKTLTNSYMSTGSKLESIRAEYKNAAEPVHVDGVCPLCKQDLPADSINTTKANAERERQAKLEEIVARGNKTDEGLKLLKEQIAHEEARLKETEKSIEAINAKVTELEKAVKSVELPPKPERMAVLEAMIEDIDKAIAEEKPADTTAMEQELKEVQQSINDEKSAQKSRNRIKELESEESNLNAELEKINFMLHLLEEFTKAKISMLEDKINGKFEIVRFKLFDQQINGGIAETCVTLVDGVPYGYGLNRGAEINAGLDIVKTLSAHYGINAPVFIDNAEAVTKLIDIDSQLIKLIVAEGKTLEVA
jgi:DNA repair exonuclease SbcCD ATPase subunit